MLSSGVISTCRMSHPRGKDYPLVETEDPSPSRRYPSADPERGLFIRPTKNARKKIHSGKLMASAPTMKDKLIIGASVKD
jgi:hypothetical protein